MSDDIIDEINIPAAQLQDMLNSKGNPPMATCHADDEPLISTFEFQGAEFYCQVCGRKYGFLSPKPAPVTPALEARLAELEAQYEIDRAKRAKS